MKRLLLGTLCSFVITLGLGACGQAGIDGGTEVGNPPIDDGILNTNAPGDPLDPPIGSALAATQLTFALCDKINQCTSSPSDLWNLQCRQRLVEVHDIGPQFGLPADTLPSLAAIALAESHEAIHANGEQLLLCTRALAEMPCNSQVHNAESAILQAIRLYQGQNTQESGEELSLVTPATPTTHPIFGMIPETCTAVYAQNG